MKKHIKSKYILGTSYPVDGISDFSDIANSMEEIFINCKNYDVSIWDFPAVIRRIQAYAKLYKSSPKYRKKDDINYSKKNNTYHSDIMIFFKVFSK